MKTNYLTYLFALVSVLALAGCKVDVPELELDSPEEVSAFRDYYHQEVLPYFYNGEFGFFDGVDNIEIAYAKFEVQDSKGAVVILHGLNETAIKYSELIYDLRDTGFSIYIMELRGHGESGRILNETEQERRKIYIKDFDNYIADTKIFYDEVVTATPHDKIFFFAHSTGGNVATQYIQQYPTDFDGAILSSPMMELLTTHPFKVPESLGYPIAKFSVALGQGEQYALDMEEPEVLIDHTSKEKFEKEFLTKDWTRWTVYNEIIEQNQHLIAGGPGATWGITNQFGKEAYEATFKARSPAEAAKIVVPVLMFQSGDDWIVGTKGQNTLQANAINAPYFEKVVFENAYHESYMADDDVRDQVVSHTKAFLEDF